MKRACGESMTNEEILLVLRRGGFSVEPWSPVIDGRGVEPRVESRYNGLLDPAGAEHLGVLLAEKARTVRPNVILVGEDVRNLVLAFVVARELGVPLVRILDEDGLVGVDGTLPARARAAVVADVFIKGELVDATQALLAQAGGELVAALSLVTRSTLNLPVRAVGLAPIEEFFPRGT